MTTIETEFRIGAGQPLPVRLLAGSFVSRRAELTIEVAPAQWSTIDMVMLFHLEWDNRNDGEIGEGGDVRIDLLLDPELNADLEQLTDGDSDDITGAIAGLDLDHALKDTEAWYALRVTEGVPLPPQLADKGEVRSGFTTIWCAD